MALRRAAHVVPAISGLRRMGAAALDLAWVAAGRFDAMYETTLHPWDVAAGMIIVREAGGFVSDIAGGDHIFETGGIVAGNEVIQRALVEILGEVR